MSLRLRLTLTYVGLMALAFALFGTVLYVTMQRALVGEMDRRLQVRSDEVQLALWPDPNAPTLADLSPSKLDLSPLTNLNAPRVYVQVVSLTGHVLATSDSLKGVALPIDRANFPAVVQGHQVHHDISVPGYPPIRVLSDPISVKGHVAAVLQVSASLQPLHETMSKLRGLLLLLGGVVLGVAALAGWFVARHGLRPLGVISGEAVDIAAKRDFARRLPLADRRDEVGQLARTIDQLLETVDGTLRSHREFLAYTSHELRNPLLAARTNLELIERVPDAEARDECVREALQQLERMSRLVSELLLLAQVEIGLVIERRHVDLAALVQCTVHEAEQRPAGRHIHIEHLEPLGMLGDEGRLQQILMNLLDNAIKHTEPQGRISVRLERLGATARLSVEDTGEGIAPEHLTHIFERGYRVSRRGAGSYGFGLAIVKQLAEAHGGRVEVESQPGRGSCFSVWLPLTASPDQGAGRRAGSAPDGALLGQQQKVPA
ncbi:MAG TPA: HAMP domain-containing sensor histidine kinase [Chloroflexota bacterium]